MLAGGAGTHRRAERGGRLRQPEVGPTAARLTADGVTSGLGRADEP